MTHTQVLQICLVVGAGFFFLGALFGIFVISYGKNGLLETRKELKGERATSEHLREFIYKVLPSMNLLSFVRAGGKAFIDGEMGKVAVSFPAQESTSVGPDTDLHAGGSSSDWNCEEQGHRFVTTNINGELTRVCMHCPHNGGSAA